VVEKYQQNLEKCLGTLTAMHRTVPTPEFPFREWVKPEGPRDQLSGIKNSLAVPHDPSPRAREIITSLNELILLADRDRRDDGKRVPMDVNELNACFRRAKKLINRELGVKNNTKETITTAQRT